VSNHKIRKVSEGEAEFNNPRKADDLEVSEVVDGYVVYQPSRDRVHYLNRTALIVLELCTGDNDTADITAVVQEAFDLSDPPAAEIEACLAQLRLESLVR
jgi:Coenzyme PQQ synthesis protein D (PqqD)